jgi:ATP-binding cassette subfamily B protein
LQQANAIAVAMAEENLGMLPAIKTFTREPLESARYRGKIESSCTWAIRSADLRRARAWRAVPGRSGHGAPALAGSATVRAAARSPAEMVSFLLYAGLLTRPVSALAASMARPGAPRRPGAPASAC